MIEVQLEQVRLELKRIRRHRAERSQEIERELYELHTRSAEASIKLSSSFRKERENFRSFHHYTDALKKESVSSNIQSAYILTLEAKLLRDMHHMLNIDKQLTLMQNQRNDRISAMRRFLIREREKASSVECQLINRIYREDKEKTEAEERYSTNLHESTRELENFFMEESQRSMASLDFHRVLEVSASSLQKLETLAEGHALKPNQVVSEIDRILMMLESVKNLNSPSNSNKSITSTKIKAVDKLGERDGSVIADMLHNLPWAN